MVKVIYLQPDANGAKVGLDDFFASGHTNEELFDRASQDVRPLPADKAPSAPSAAQRLIEMCSEVTLFRSEREEAFASIKVRDHWETWPVRSKAFRKWLGFQFYQEGGKPPNSQALEEALSVLEAKCDFHGEMRPLSLRIAQDGDTLWLDLTNDIWQAMRITPDGWSVAAGPPLFRRYAPAAAQVLPQADGDLSLLRQFVNVRDESLYRQLVVWLVACFFPEIAHPVLVVYGEQGSAKSTLMGLLARLVDPSKVPLRVEPRDVGEWVQAADHSWMVTLDNVSQLRGWLSDALCRAVTGEGFSKRQLYSDADDVIISFRRVVALTGIEVVPERADLFDRALLLELEPIVPERRRSETEVLADFERLRPEILGGLLDVVSGVLAELPSVNLKYLPRMADFARIGVAVERVLEWPDGTFMAAYGCNIAGQHEEALSMSVLNEPLQALMRSKSEWAGTAKELLNALSGPAGEPVTKSRDWPKSAKAISGLLRRMAPNLRAVGLAVEFTTPHGKRLITVTRMGVEKTVPTSTTGFGHLPAGTQGDNAGTQSGRGGTEPDPLCQEGNAGNAIVPLRSGSGFYPGSDCFGFTDTDAPVAAGSQSFSGHDDWDQDNPYPVPQGHPQPTVTSVPSSPNGLSDRPESLPGDREGTPHGQNARYGHSSDRRKEVPDPPSWNIDDMEEGEV